MREHPGLQVHVSELGAPHLIEPERLERSARRLYGDSFDSLWGELAPVPQENVHVVGATVLGLDCFPSPGHASHHVCYLDGDGTLWAGDAAGVRLEGGHSVLPPTPPPDIDIDAWQSTLDEIDRRDPSRLALIHFGVATDPMHHLDELRLRLLDWAEAVEGGSPEDEFIAYAKQELELAGDDADDYDTAMPLWQSYRGLKRWADKRAERTRIGSPSCRPFLSRSTSMRFSRCRTRQSSPPSARTARRTPPPPGTTGRTAACC